uniref:Uncharacterized protein n=1 Tax=Rhizophora mucronata TaxID=61149 RepID=A0A2P2PJ52_RHIMU
MDDSIELPFQASGFHMPALNCLGGILHVKLRIFESY